MKRRKFLAATVVAICVAGGPAFATSTKDALIRQLRGQGFQSIKVGRTLLGRTRIIAESPKYQREIVFNPRTGEILRDYWVEVKTGKSVFAPDNGATGGASSGGSSGGGSGGSGGDDDDDDDDDDNNDDHDDDDDDDDDDGGDDDDGDDDNDEGGDDHEDDEDD